MAYRLFENGDDLFKAKAVLHHWQDRRQWLAPFNKLVAEGHPSARLFPSMEAAYRFRDSLPRDVGGCYLPTLVIED